MIETTPAVKLRSEVVRMVVRSLIALTCYLYLLIGTLLLLKYTVPEALWLAAGGSSGALGSLLVNSKNDSPPPGSPGAPPLAVEGVPEGEPVATKDVDPDGGEVVEDVERDLEGLPAAKKRR